MNENLQATRLSRMSAATWGVHFAALQVSYFFLAEVYISSQIISYFIITISWLIGSLIGFKLKTLKFIPLIVVSLLLYYSSLILSQNLPFDYSIIFFIAPCSAVSGLSTGVFFRYYARYVSSARLLLFDENNGFLLGMLAALVISVLAGKWYLLSAAGITGFFAVVLILALKSTPSNSN